jgi:DMSO/TMAO reductase YedYZ molybdopterin-dependent catalytic subunit
MLSRRQLVQHFGGAAMALGAGDLWSTLAAATGTAEQRPNLSPDRPAGTRAEAILEALPGKKPLIKLTYRPPNYETPVSYLDSLFTPNDAFFVRYHLADIPEVDEGSWKLRVGGEAVGSPIELTLDDLRRFEPVELAAVCMCAGNQRGLFQPHVPGIQWGSGAMGNAVWKGARLNDVLNRAGIKKEAIEIAFDGADAPVAEGTPDFVKSLPIWKALDENTLIAYEMNGQPLPHFNGFPARLVVPGWTATYWVKHLTSIEALTKPFDGYWVKSAYRIPQGKFPVIERFLTQERPANAPITEMMVNSLITHPADGANAPLRRPTEIRGIAWDGGYGIRAVEISSDGGKGWQDAALGEDHGRFSFRPWRFRWTPSQRGQHTIFAKASNRAGQTQISQLILNPAGYHNNLIQRVTLTAS